MALFRFCVLAELLHLPPVSPKRAAALRANARRDYDIPGRRRVAEQTLRDWLRLYHEGGFDALHPKPRSGRGCPGRTPTAVAALLTEFKERHPEWSVRTVMR